MFVCFELMNSIIGCNHISINLVFKSALIDFISGCMYALY